MVGFRLRTINSHLLSQRPAETALTNSRHRFGGNKTETEPDRTETAEKTICLIAGQDVAQSMSAEAADRASAAAAAAEI